MSRRIYKNSLKWYIKWCKIIARDLNISLRFTKLPSNTDRLECGGHVDLSKDRIYISYYRPYKNDLIHTFLHEVTHVFCKRYSIYPIYHGSNIKCKNYAKYIAYFKATALRAEQYVEKLTKFKALLPKEKFYPFYKNKSDIKYLKNHINNYFNS